MNELNVLTRESTIKDLVDRVNELVSLVNDSVSPAMCLKRIQPTEVYSFSKDTVDLTGTVYTIPLTGVYKVLFTGTGKVQCIIKTEFNETLFDSGSKTIINSVYEVNETLLADGDTLQIYATPSNTAEPIQVQVILQSSFLDLITAVTQICDSISETIKVIQNTEKSYSENLENMQKAIDNIKLSIAERYEDFDNCKTDPNTGVTYETVQDRLSALTSVVQQIIRGFENEAQDLINECKRIIAEGKEEVEGYIDKSIGNLNNLHLNYNGAKNLVEALNKVPEFTGIYVNTYIDPSDISISASASGTGITSLNVYCNTGLMIYNGDYYQPCSSSDTFQFSTGSPYYEFEKFFVLFSDGGQTKAINITGTTDSSLSKYYYYDHNTGEMCPYFDEITAYEYQDTEGILFGAFKITGEYNTVPNGHGTMAWTFEITTALPDEELSGVQTPYTNPCKMVIGTISEGHTLYDCDFLCNGNNDSEVINAAIVATHFITIGTQTKLNENITLDKEFAGGEVAIRAGTYNLNAPININYSNISLKGEAGAKFVRQWDCETNGNFDTTYQRGIISIGYQPESSISNIVIDRLIFDGNKDAQTSENNCGIQVYSTDNTNCPISHIAISNCTFDSCSAEGVRIQNATNVTVANTTVTNIGTHGISLYGTYNTLVSNTKLYGNSTGIGISTDRLTNCTQISECYISGLTQGANLLGEDIKISNNAITECSYGITYASLYYPCKHVKILNNTLLQISNKGIFDNGGYASYTTKASEDIIISNNTIIGTKTQTELLAITTWNYENVGIHCYLSTEVTIYNNTITNFVFGMHIYTYGKNTGYGKYSIQNNTIKFNSRGLSVQRVCYSKIAFNSCLNNYSQNMYFYSVHGCTITQNITGWNGDVPEGGTLHSLSIYTSDASTYVPTKYNMISFNIFCGVNYTTDASASSLYNTFVNNTVIPSTETAIPNP